jgi:UDP:flavonoid glycosyltransferase YjiC (YdhE family)
MQAISEIAPSIRFEIFTSVPAWFFKDSLTLPFGYHKIITDIGMVQKTPFSEDSQKSIERLNHFLPFEADRIDHLSATINRLGCRLIICDIAPMGINVARAAAIPSILIENFTWDWIYEGYRELSRQAERHICYLRDVFTRADFHIQTQPVCRPDTADLTLPPISRQPLTPPEITRNKLGIDVNKKIVLISTGGIPQTYGFLDSLQKMDYITFIIPGGGPQATRHQNVIILPHRSDYYHPDLVLASDAVVGKAGYSTLAEVYRAGVPFGYVTRPDFRESEILARYIQAEMSGFELSIGEFEKGAWVSGLKPLLDFPRIQRKNNGAAVAAAQFIIDRFGNTCAY